MSSKCGSYQFLPGSPTYENCLSGVYSSIVTTLIFIVMVNSAFTSFLRRTHVSTHARTHGPTHPGLENPLIEVGRAHLKILVQFEQISWKSIKETLSLTETKNRRRMKMKKIFLWHFHYFHDWLSGHTKNLNGFWTNPTDRKFIQS